MDDKAKNGSLSAASGGNSGGSIEKELAQKKQKHRERARAYYLRNKAHVLEKAKTRYRQRRESQKKAEEQKRAGGQEIPASTGGVIGVPKGIGKAEVPKKYEGPPLLRVLEFVADKLAAQQAKAEPALLAPQSAENVGNEDGQWGQWAIQSAPSKQSEYERYMREREGQKMAAPPPPPPPPPGFRNFDMGNGKIIHVRISPESSPGKLEKKV